MLPIYTFTCKNTGSTYLSVKRKKDICLNLHLFFFDEIRNILYCFERKCFFIGNRYAEILFDSHQHINDFKGIGAKILDNIGVVVNCGWIDTELLGK